MRHFIIGRGTLGTSLYRELLSRGHEVTVVPGAQFNTIPDSEDHTIWNTIGYGSVGECKANPGEAFRVHVVFTNELITRHPKADLICFSTNYVVDADRPDSQFPTDDHLSVYSFTKGVMETVIRSSLKKNVYGIRVANLYSAATRERSLAYRLLTNAPRISSLPPNEIIPTDTDWLAAKLATYLPNLKDSGKKILGMAPLGKVSTKDFGEKVLGKQVEQSVDHERPLYTTVHNDFDIRETWQDVWNAARDYREPQLSRCLF